MARNTALILQEEGHLHRVIDPAGGSWFLDSITDQLAKEAWSIFQEVERLGGMLAVLESGWVNDQIAAAYAPRASDIARRKEGITGVSEFPNLAEDRVVHGLPDIDALKGCGESRVPRLVDPAKGRISLSRAVQRFKTAAAVTAAAEGCYDRTVGPRIWIPQVGVRAAAAPGQELCRAVRGIARRERCLASAIHGSRPSVYLVNLGTETHHTARATFAKNFFEAGGFDVLSSDGCCDADAAAGAYAKSGSRIAVICSSDQLYQDMVPQVAPKLKAAGARTVILAGSPGKNEPAWREAGVDRFIFVKV